MLHGDYLLLKNLSVFIAIIASFVNFLLPSKRVRGGLGWGKKFTIPARVAIYWKCFRNGLTVVLKCAVYGRFEGCISMKADKLEIGVGRPVERGRRKEPEEVFLQI
ncbi:hypothetical protein QUA32_15240 [Microcoleus sp. Pol14D6]|uniref:hypothetical protein n=1 Tax=Microcoleus sp. Pol14D5 TaxID=3055401 RepID=UPI002FD45355